MQQEYPELSAEEHSYCLITQLLGSGQSQIGFENVWVVCIWHLLAFHSEKVHSGRIDRPHGSQ